MQIQLLFQNAGEDKFSIVYIYKINSNSKHVTQAQKITLSSFDEKVRYVSSVYAPSGPALISGFSMKNEATSIAP